MPECKAVKVPLAPYFRFSKKGEPQDEEDKYMEQVSYARLVRSLMYEMICTKHDLANSLSVLSIFMPNLGRGH